MRFRPTLLVIMTAGALVMPARALPPGPNGPAPVEMRATVRSIVQEGRDKRTYINLKILPGSKLPFTTQRFLVRDPALVAGLSREASVKFRAERLEGENTLVAIRAVAACVRFQPCD